MISRLVFASLTALFAFRREDSDVGLTFRSFTLLTHSDPERSCNVGLLSGVYRAQTEPSAQSLAERIHLFSDQQLVCAGEAGLTFLLKQWIMGDYQGCEKRSAVSLLCVCVRVRASSSASSLGIDFTRVIDGLAAAAVLSPLTAM